MSRKPLASGTRVETHAIALSMMRMCGVDPIKAMGQEAKWPEGHSPDYVENDGGKMRMRFALDERRRVHVTVNGTDACVSVRGQSFPESVLPAVAGLRLSAVVDHVLLTGAHVGVRKARPFDPLEDGIGTHFDLEEQNALVVAP